MPTSNPPTVLSPQVLRWLLFLAGYQYTLQSRPGKAMGHVDFLSHLLLPETGPDPAPALQTLHIEDLPDAPLHAEDIAKGTSQDKILLRVLD